MSGTRRVAVVGGGVAGLTAAGLLARQGHAVTLFEATARPGGKAQGVCVDGVTLDTGPTLLTLPAVVRGTFEALGASHVVPRLTELDPQCHYHFADGCTFTAYRDVERTAESAGALRHVEARGVRSFYAEAEAIWRAAGEPYLEAPFEGMAGFLARVARRGPGAVVAGTRLATLATLAARHFRTDHLRQFAGRFATYAGASPYAASAAFAQIAHVERAFGVHHVQGGVGALVDALAHAAEAAGVRVVTHARAGWARERGGRWRVGPEGGAEAFDAVVVNADPLASLGRAHEPLSLSGYVLLLELEPGAGAGLPHHCVLFSQDYRREFDTLFAGRLPDDPTVYFCHPASTDPTMGAEGRTGLYVMVNAPALAHGARPADWGEATERVRTQALARLLAAYPRLRGRMRVLGERTPVDLAALGAPGGSIYGFLPHGRLGPFRRPRLRGGAPGLFYTGGGTHPGGGVPLCMLSGRFAAGLAHEALGGARAPHVVSLGVSGQVLRLPTASAPAASPPVEVLPAASLPNEARPAASRPAASAAPTARPPHPPAPRCLAPERRDR